MTTPDVWVVPLAFALGALWQYLRVRRVLRQDRRQVAHIARLNRQIERGAIRKEEGP